MSMQVGPGISINIHVTSDTDGMASREYVEEKIQEAERGEIKTVNGAAPDENGNVQVSGLPEGAGAYQQLVTDGEGKVKWEERTHYTKDIVKVQASAAEDSSLYKVTDDVPNITPTVGDAVTFWVVENEVPSSARTGEVMLVQDNLYGFVGGAIMIATEDNIVLKVNETISFTFPEKGVYFLYADSLYVSGFAMGENAETPTISWDGNITGIHTILEKYIPSTIARTADLHPVATSGSWNDLTDKLFGEEMVETLNQLFYAPNTLDNFGYDDRLEASFLSETNVNGGHPFTTEIGKNYEFSMHVEEDTKTYTGRFTATDTNVQTFTVYDKDDSTRSFEVRIRGGYYVEAYLTEFYPGTIQLHPVVFTFSEVVTDEIITPFPERYLPENVPVIPTAAVGQTIVVKAVDEEGKPTEWEAVDPWIIASSTEGSTKRFKITIDDSGNLTTTEVTE